MASVSLVRGSAVTLNLLQKSILTTWHRVRMTFGLCFEKISNLFQKLKNGEHRHTDADNMMRS